MEADMDVLVTGASGYVGAQVARKLVERGERVTGLIRGPERARALPAGVTPVVGDLADAEGTAELASRYEAVVHTGFAAHGRDWAAAVEIERRGVAALVEALAGRDRTLIVSNGTLFLGDSGAGRHAETAPIARDHPAAVRADATARATAASDLRGIELRLASFVYGRGGSVFLPILLEAAERTGRSVYVGAGAVTTSAVHVDAAADAYLAALDRGEAGATYHIASDEEPTLRQVAEAVALATGTQAESVSGEDAAALLDPFTAMFMQTNNRLDSWKARCELRWTPAGLPPLLWDVAFGSYRRV
jgi:nucleoside-diphosphate-sugar epimerase